MLQNKIPKRLGLIQRAMFTLFVSSAFRGGLSDFFALGMIPAACRSSC